MIINGGLNYIIQILNPKYKNEDLEKHYNGFNYYLSNKYFRNIQSCKILLFLFIKNQLLLYKNETHILK